MKLKVLVWNNEDRGLYILVLNLFPIYLTFYSPLKNFKLLEKFGNWWYNKGQVFDKTHVKLCHLIEKLGFARGVVGMGMFIKPWTFLGSITFLFLDTIKPRIVFKNTMNAHLFGLRLIPNFLHLKKHFLSFSRHVDKSLKIVKSSRNIFMNTLMYSWNVLVIALW